MSKQVMQRALDALEEISHAVHEIHHARTNPRWFTGGQHAAMQHEILWIGKSAEIVRNKTSDAIAELRAEIAKSVEPVAFLADATRFKVRGDEDSEACRIYGIPHELNGRWVALVAADDNCHLKLTAPPDAEAMRRDAERYRHLMQTAYPHIAHMLGVKFGDYTPGHDIIRNIGLNIDAEMATKI